DGATGLSLLESGSADVVILDLHLPGMGGLEVLERIRVAFPSLPVVVLTAFGEVRSAVRATKLGAFDYLTKPVDHEQLLLSVNRALETHELRLEVEDLRHRAGLAGGLSVAMGPSAAVSRVNAQVRAVAATNFSVLIQGETGTGKELIAQAIHRQSHRRSKPFVAIDCGAIPETLIESELFGHERGAFTGAARRSPGQFGAAQGGTVFLDEIGNMPLKLQGKLLRVLESRQVQAIGSSTSAPLDVRFLAATNHDLQLLAGSGRFRSDLYFRLAQYSISLPPLRERKSDIAYLAEHCLKEVSVELRRPMLDIARDALSMLQGYSWPGNVRELRNVVRQSVLDSSGLTLRAETLKPLLQPTQSASIAVEVCEVELPTLRHAARSAAKAAERSLIEAALKRTRGNKSQAARLLQTDYKTLYVKMKSLGLRGSAEQTERLTRARERGSS
ncbi:MAG: two component, sigma54 specific, transcriptional regulator, Fis family, partial [Polyangiaceae bacterium]|nr:two component, sigma54 specific, transcriptional regulator, Fis family [Polyangiaceae bacterium]